MTLSDAEQSQTVQFRHYQLTGTDSLIEVEEVYVIDQFVGLCDCEQDNPKILDGSGLWSTFWICIMTDFGRDLDCYRDISKCCGWIF